MYGQEETFARSFDKATSVCTVVAAVSLATGLLFANSLCDMDLSEWHIVNAILCGSLAAAAHFATRVNPRAMQAGFRVYKAETSMRELMSEGVLSAAASVALVACPALLLFWSARGFASMGVGICAESAPMFFAISLSIMLAEAAALIYVIGRNLQAAGYSLDKLKYQGEMLLARAKDLASDWSRNGYHYVMRAYENVIPTIKQIIHSLLEMVHRMWEQRPRWMNASYWAGSEGSYLLR
ncbi:hypothetical protein, conserved [Eimeria acervulina]|uniref:Uncharacterized protein n=1 Tax=Eimeria acervulina TaxID=5801 RepID=U6GMA1_EIMAC|nr:hypothetical protein, conserved [Eimeria acervulina]CDI81310.1 hypothetical protein, conserved [Eimeria acervulina]